VHTKVSIIIPCFNVVHFIEECLASAFQQTYSDIEVIAVDNNSSDGTYDKLVELQQTQYPSLILLQETKRGACAARNKGLSIAQGEWIQFLDADDLLMPTKIEHQMSLLANKKIKNSFLMGSTIFYNNKGVKYNTKYISVGNPILKVFKQQAGYTCSNLFNKECLLQINGWDETLSSSQETDLMLRLIMLGRDVVYDKDALTIKNERESGQISQSNPTIRWSNFIKIRIQFLKMVINRKVLIDEAVAYELYSYLFSSILILSKYDAKKALYYYNQINNWGKYIKPQFGVRKIHLLLIKLLGPKGVFKLQSQLFRLKFKSSS